MQQYSGVQPAVPSGTNAARSRASHAPSADTIHDRALQVELEPAWKRQYWALRLRVDEFALREAVGRVGPAVESVRQDLARRAGTVRQPHQPA